MEARSGQNYWNIFVSATLLIKLLSIVVITT